MSKDIFLVSVSQSEKNITMIALVAEQRVSKQKGL